MKSLRVGVGKSWWLGVGLAVALASGNALAQETPPAQTAWPAPVAGWQAPQPGEHPRLFFRKADLPALRARAKTAEGQEILARLKATLGGGEAMPTHFNPNRSLNDPAVKLPEGAFTFSHAAGFGFLYQLTGEKKYAELARQCVEKSLAGVRDRDNRYSVIFSSGQLRAGPSLGWTAVAYDFCYDAWPAEFRDKVRRFLEKGEFELDGKLQKDEHRLEMLVTKTRQFPACNHWGAIIGGAGLTVLALLDDPGADAALLRQYLATVETKAQAAVTQGFGDGGYFAEGPGPSHVMSQTALLPFFQAMKVAGGKDYITPRPNVPWITLRWVMELSQSNEGDPIYPCRSENTYGTRKFLKGNGGVSHGGWFAEGFGAIPDKYKPALLWTYNNLIAKQDQGRRDTATYPHRAVLAFLNWPIGVTPQNPAQVLPRAVADNVHGYYMMRSRWQDKDDVIITLLQKRGPVGNMHKVHTEAINGLALNQIYVWGLGEQLSLPWRLAKSVPSEFGVQADDTGRLVIDSFQLAVDFSRRSGAEAVLARLNGPGTKFTTAKAYDQTVRLDGQAVAIMTLCAGGKHPKAKLVKTAAGEAVQLGGLQISLVAGKLQFAAAPGVSAGLGADLFDASGQVPVVAVAAEADVKLPTDALFHLSFDRNTIFEKDGKIAARELRGTGADATLEGMTLVPGLAGGAIRSSPAGVAEVPAHPVLDLGNKSWSVSYVFHAEESPGQGVLVTGHNYSGWAYYLGWHPDRLYFDYIGASQPYQFEPGASHVVWAYDLPSRTLTIYYNGRIVATRPGVGPFTSHAELAWRLDSTLDGRACSNVDIDDLAIYPRALSLGEVTALHRQAQASLREEDTLPADTPPLGRIKPSTAKALPGVAINFDASASTSPLNLPLEYAWDFGDGTKATGVKATHTYRQHGTYLCRLSVRDSKGNSSVSQHTIAIHDNPPVAVVEINPPRIDGRGRKIPVPRPPGVFDFTAERSSDPEGQPLRFAWKTSDGQTATEPKTQFRFTKPGRYDVFLTITDATGQWTTVRRVLDVADDSGLRAPDAPATTLPGLHYRYYFTHGYPVDSATPPDASFFASQYLRKEGITHTLNFDSINQRVGFTATLWSGYLQVPADGEYTFHVDAQRLFFCLLGNTTAIAHGARGETTTSSHKIKLRQGLHRARFIHYAHKPPTPIKPFDYWAHLEWEGPSLTRRPLLAGDFRRSPTAAETAALGLGQFVVGSDVCDLVDNASPALGVSPIGASLAGNKPPRIDAVRLEVPEAAGWRVIQAQAQATDPEGDPLTYQWEFGDAATAQGASVEHTYHPGDFVVRLTVTDGKGGQATAVRRLEVKGRPTLAIGLDLRGGGELRPFTGATAGWQSQPCWNACWPADPKTPTRFTPEESLRDSAGWPTTAKVASLQTGKTQNTPLADATPDARLMASSVHLTGLELTGIPYARYDVYVYGPSLMNNRAPQLKIPTVVRLGDKSLTLLGERVWSGRYIDGTASAGKDWANYVVFRGISGPQLQLQFAAGDRGAGPIAAVQIVQAE